LRLQLGEARLQLAVKATAFKLQQQPYRLLSFQNIEVELQAQELAAWQQLMRILTHEIMNSVTPLTSLTGTLEAMLDDLRPEMEAGALASWQADSRAGLQAIGRRGQGLLRFTQAYRKLAQVPELRPECFEVMPWLEGMVQLFATEMKQRSIALHWTRPPRAIWLEADQALLEQVVVNLLQNALEAVKAVPQPSLHLSVQLGESGQLMVSIADNGPGIPAAVQERMFVPFFTTKNGGSGIGLSLSRQLVQLHRGRLQVQARSGQAGAVATLSLPGASYGQAAISGPEI
jgi:signal transduction histidine kinase